jgi:hypothetical protein
MIKRSMQFGMLAAALLATPVSDGLAQRGDRQGGGRANREQMEQQFRQRVANLLRTQLGLTDEGMRQLSEVNQRFDQQRRGLLRQEMMTRRSLREEVLKRDSADARRVEQLISDQFRIERERLDLNEAEQRELGKFLTPVQRARYLGVQEQIRREMDQLRGRRGMGESQPQRRRPPGG